jgi:hypothetical protein
MLGLFRAVVERVKAVLVVRAAREIEADALAHAAHRKSELLELAARYEAEGQAEVAGELRVVIGTADDDRPLAGVLPAVEHLTGGAAARGGGLGAGPECGCGRRRLAVPAPGSGTGLSGITLVPAATGERNRLRFRATQNRGCLSAGPLPPHERLVISRLWLR